MKNQKNKEIEEYTN